MSVHFPRIGDDESVICFRSSRHSRVKEQTATEETFNWAATTVMTKIDIGGFTHRRIAVLPVLVAAKPGLIAAEQAILTVVSGTSTSGCTRESISENNQPRFKLSTTSICRRDMLVMLQDVESHNVLLQPCG